MSLITTAPRTCVRCSLSHRRVVLVKLFASSSSSVAYLGPLDSYLAQHHVSPTKLLRTPAHI